MALDDDMNRNDPPRDNARPDPRNDSSDGNDDARTDGQPDPQNNRLVGAPSLIEAIRLSRTLENMNPREKEAARELSEVDQKITGLKMQGISEQEINEAIGTLPAHADPIMAAQEALKKLDELKAAEEQEARDRLVKEREAAEKAAVEAQAFYRDAVAAVAQASYLLAPMGGSSMMTPDSSNPLNPGNTPGMFSGAGGRSFT